MSRTESKKSGRGFFAIGVYHPKKSINIGTLFRSAAILGAAYTFTVGPRYQPQVSDTMKCWRHMPHFNYPDLATFNEARPYHAQLIGVELTPNAIPLKSFGHPLSAIYMLGAEDAGLSQEALDLCQHVVVLPGDYSMNVAVAGSIVLYDRVTR
jgi:tRNA G18 (ribose-2'-O)-methylase SpoU